MAKNLHARIVKGARMKTIADEELAEIIEKHQKWVETGRAEGERADLSNTDLNHKNFSFKNLQGADFSYSDLSYAIFSDANLNGTHFEGAEADHTKFIRATLTGAHFWSTNLHDSDMKLSELPYADMHDADLSNVNFSYSNLPWASLNGANLYNTNWYCACFYMADLRNAKNIPSCVQSITSILPEGEIIGYKKAYCDLYQACLVKLRIPADAKRSNSTGRKCRCDKAIVESAEYLDGTQIDSKNIICSLYERAFTYHIGDTIRPDKFDNNRWAECSNGIHFFITKEEALSYNS